jgi:hypothetical protein
VVTVWCRPGRRKRSPVRDGLSAKTAVPGSSASVQSVITRKIAVAGGVFALGHLGELITDQSPVPDQLVIIQHTRHKASGSLTKRVASTPPRTPQTESILDATDQSRPENIERSLDSQATRSDLGERNPVYRVTPVLQTPQAATTQCRDQNQKRYAQLLWGG